MTITYVKTVEEYKALLETSKEKLVVIDFTASWCGPCRYIGPIFEKMASEHPDVTFVKVDVDEAQDVSSACGVQAMPTFQFFKAGAKIETLRGANEEKLVALVDELRMAGVTKSRDSEMRHFADACMSGDEENVQDYLKTYPAFATLPVPDEWHYKHIRRGGWQPVEKTLNPGVMNAGKTTFLISNPPAYGLHLAAGNGHTKVVQTLLNAGADIEAADGDGDTVLTWATWCARQDVMDQLLAAGADASFADKLSVAEFEGIQGNGASLQYLKNKRKNKA